MSGLPVGIFGVSGIGKSTLLDAHVAIHPADTHVGGSSVVKAIIAPHSVRELDAWPEERRARVRKESIRRLGEKLEHSERHLLVAGHFTLRNRNTGKLERILTPDDHAFFRALVHLDATPQMVLAQVQADPRARHGQTPVQIAEHLEFERQVATETASEMGVPMVRVTATELTARLDELAAFLDQVAGATPC